MLVEKTIGFIGVLDTWTAQNTPTDLSGSLELGTRRFQEPPWAARGEIFRTGLDKYLVMSLTFVFDLLFFENVCFSLVL